MILEDILFKVSLLGGGSQGVFYLDIGGWTIPRVGGSGNLAPTIWIRNQINRRGGVSPPKPIGQGQETWPLQFALGNRINRRGGVSPPKPIGQGQETWPLQFALGNRINCRGGVSPPKPISAISKSLSPVIRLKQLGNVTNAIDNVSHIADVTAAFVGSEDLSLESQK